MKIMLLNHVPFEGTGSGVYVRNVARELVRKGHEVLTIIPDYTIQANDLFRTMTITFNDGNNANCLLDFNFPVFTTHPRSRITFFNLSPQQLGKYIQVWEETISAAIESFLPDVIHANHIWIIPYVLHKSGKPFFVTCHGTDIMGFKRCGKNSPYREMALEAAKHAYQIIAVSNYIQKSVSDTFCIPESKIEVINNGFDPECFYLDLGTNKGEIQKELGLPISSQPVLVYVGKFTHFKGIDVLLRAATIYEKALDGIQTVLIGDGDLLNEMKELSKSLNLKRVYFCGYKSQNIIARLYNVADISVFPSRYEPFGLQALESIACGTPVIATDEGGFRDFIDNSLGKLVSSNDPYRLGNVIVDSIKNNIKVTKGLFASKYALKYFTWSRCVSRLEFLYQEMEKNKVESI